MITFRIAHHFERNVDVVEIILDGNHLLGVLYPQANGVQLISKYLDSENIHIDESFPTRLEILLP